MQKNNETLQCAAERGHLDIVKYFFNNSSNLCARNNEALRHSTTF